MVAQRQHHDDQSRDRSHAAGDDNFPRSFAVHKKYSVVLTKS
jgi:hypothetical protein